MPTRTAIVEPAARTAGRAGLLADRHLAAPQRYLESKGVPVGQASTRCWKAGPIWWTRIKNGEIQLVFNTTEGRQALADSSSIRRAACPLA